MKKLVGFTMLLAMVFAFSSLNEKKEEAKLALEDDSYKVIKVNGQIVFTKSGNAMKTGDVFASSTSLSFKTSESRAAVISRKRGRFVLTSKTGGSSKANLIPAMNNIATRGTTALLNLIDMQNHFKGKYVVLGKQKLKIGEKNFPMDDANFFYLQYTHNNETIRKRLSFEKDNHLLLDKKEIFKIDGEPIPVEEKTMKLYYRSNGASKVISTFTPVFPNLDELTAELKVIQQEYADKNNTELKGEFKAYINQFYGTPDSENLSDFVKNSLGIE